MDAELPSRSRDHGGDRERRRQFAKMATGYEANMERKETKSSFQWKLVDVASRTSKPLRHMENQMGSQGISGG